mmetsp:Transcript_41609/g.89324  ORF Transcript_41609/g.89324 Transcript_41609/m.89324 type:complete len:92 (+) Transcript_41609:1170-1445(+)
MGMPQHVGSLLAAEDGAAGGIVGSRSAFEALSIEVGAKKLANFENLPELPLGSTSGSVSGFFQSGSINEPTYLQQQQHLHLVGLLQRRSLQ